MLPAIADAVTEGIGSTGRGRPNPSTKNAMTPTAAIETLMASSRLAARRFSGCEALQRNPELSFAGADQLISVGPGASARLIVVVRRSVSDELRVASHREPMRISFAILACVHQLAGFTSK